MKPSETGSAALVVAPDAAQAGGGDTILEPSPEADSDVNPLAAEVHAWRARRGPGMTTTWEVSRRKCAVWAVLIPVLVMAINAAVLLVSAPAVDPELRSAVIVVVTAFWLGLTLLVVREYALLAIFGGGLSATPDGLRFWFGRKSMLMPWTDIESVGVEGRSNTKGGSDTVLAIRFLEGDYHWPWASSLWSSKPYRLCISPYILAEPAQVVADGLLASLDQHSDPASRGSRKASRRGPRRHLVLRIVSIAVCLFVVATVVYRIPQMLAAFDWVSLLLAVVFLLVAGGLAIGFWRGGDAFYEAFFSDE
jgi:hypothetical protein